MRVHQVAGSTPGRLGVGCNPGQVVHTRVHQLPSSVSWYQPTVDLASWWSCIAGTAVYTGSTAQDREMSTPPVFFRGRGTFMFTLLTFPPENSV